MSMEVYPHMLLADVLWDKQAITARYFDADAPYAYSLVGWIRQLFALQK